MMSSAIRRLVSSQSTCHRLLRPTVPEGALAWSRIRSFATSTGDDDGTITVPVEEARATTTRALEMIGWGRDDAALQAEIMVAAELAGNNQGLVKMYQPQMMRPQPGAGSPTVERETRNAAVLNAHQAPGMLAAVMGADKAIELCLEKQNTVSIVCTHNTSTSSGQLGYYAERIARRGLIGLCLANSPEMVAAAPGGKPVFGTNPLAVGIPQRGPYPFTFDMATSAVALFGVLSAKAKGEPLPPQVAYGKSGDWTTDATEVLEGGGAIATFGGHKGAGLALCVELLAGALSGGAVLGLVEKRAAKSWGHTFIAINPSDLVEDFDTKSAAVIAAVKASGANIRIPGERSMTTAEERRQAGVLPIPRKIWESILHTAANGLKE